MIKAIIRIIRLHLEALLGKVSVENTKNIRIVGKVFREKERERHLDGFCTITTTWIRALSLSLA